MVDCVQSMKRKYSDIYGERASSDGWNQTNLTQTLELCIRGDNSKKGNNACYRGSLVLG